MYIIWYQHAKLYSRFKTCWLFTLSHILVTLNHYINYNEGLVAKLATFGIKGRPLDWFVSYLSEGIQRVIINGQYSDWASVKAGVHQCSVLGPLLFSGLYK